MASTITGKRSGAPDAFTIEQLYLVADDEQATVLEDLQVRLGWLWRCRCAYLNVPEVADCEGCGRDRQGVRMLHPGAQA